MTAASGDLALLERLEKLENQDFWAAANAAGGPVRLADRLFEAARDATGDLELVNRYVAVIDRLMEKIPPPGSRMTQAR